MYSPADQRIDSQLPHLHIARNGNIFIIIIDKEPNDQLDAPFCHYLKMKEASKAEIGVYGKIGWELYLDVAKVLGGSDVALNPKYLRQRSQTLAEL